MSLQKIVSLLCIGSIVLTIAPLHADTLALVKGKVRAVIVTADSPSPVASYASEELVTHIKKATGAELRVVRESEVSNSSDTPYIYLGNTRAALSKGIEPDRLENDESILRVIGDNLYILGKEGPRGPFDERAGSLRGTLFGVYEFLERYADVRWLWPGELGTYVPKTKDLGIDASVNEIIKPNFRFRRARISHVIRQVKSPDPLVTKAGFSKAGAEKYLRALRVFLARYRLGNTDPKPTVGHHFSGWWKRYGKQHPEWFMLNEEGTRGPKTDATDNQLEHVAMCVSNPDLHRYIVEEHWDGGNVLSLGEVDVRVFCQCEKCLAWDVPPTAPPPQFARLDYEPRNVSDRYARFWKTIHEMASKRNPNVMVTTFLYWNYLPAPNGDIQLNKNIYAEYVPWTGPYVYFPMAPERDQWSRAQWLKWKERGVTLAYRPNYLLGGYVFPALSTWQAGEFFRFAHQNGMVGFDYDSLHGHWAVKGPMLYMHMRLFVEPDTEIATLRKEYFQAFGPAAKEVERYFDFWEERAIRSEVQGGNPLDIFSKYPPAALKEAEQILTDALKAAEESPDRQYADRVRFLQIGLEHSVLAANLVRSIGRGKIRDVPPGAFGDDGLPSSMAGLPRDTRRYLKARQALADLVAFRRQHEGLFFSDLVAAVSREKRLGIALLFLESPPQEGD